MTQSSFSRRLNVPGALCMIAFGLVSGAAAASEITMLSTQLRPVDEAEKVRNVLLKGASDTVKFIPEETGPFTTRLGAEIKAGKGMVSLAGALDSEFASVGTNNLNDLSGLMTKLSANRAFTPAFVELGKLGGDKVRMVPWMYASYIMAANKKALPYLPKGVDVNTLTYQQLREWAENVKKATGESKLGFPAGPKGLMHRFFQGFLYPSYTGGQVTTFRSADAEKMWTDFRDMWQFVHPRSTTYGAMEEPLSSGEVWIAFDHTARLLSALRDKPAEFVTFPAPIGPKGRGYMLVLSGLSIPASSPDAAAAERTIDHLTSAPVQVATMKETGFFPVLQKFDAPDLNEGIKMANQAMTDQSLSKVSKAGVIPAGLGAKGGEYNKFFIDSFTRIVIRNEDVKAVVQEQGAALDTFMKAANVPCWLPDPVGTAACAVK